MSFAGLVLLREGKGQLLDCKLVEDDEWSVDADVVNRRGDDADDVIATELGPGSASVWTLVWFGGVVLCCVNEVPGSE
jgi:hypothetical protein